MPVRVEYKIRDGKGKTSPRTVYIPDTFTLDQMLEFGTEFGQLIADVVTGQIYDAVLNIPIPIGGLTSNATPAGSVDVEEGAKLALRAGTEGYPVLMRFPTFAEAHMVDGTDQVDLTSTEVDALVDAIIGGVAVAADSGATVTLTDYRGEDITALDYFRDDFIKSRR